MRLSADDPTTCSEGAIRVEFSFRCSDAAYARLFRRLPRTNGYEGPERRHDPGAAAQDIIDETKPGDRFAAVINRFLDAAERDPGILLLQPPPSGALRVRKLWVDAEVKRRFDEFAEKTPVSREVLAREAIYRFTSKC